ncbi:MAG: hypothetical protein Kow00109_00490 [Acidobacteriota bacterium]
MSKRGLFWLAAWSTLLLLCRGAAAEPHVGGRVNALLLDRDGDPVPGVLVALVGAAGETSSLPTWAKTNEAGRALLDGIAAGTYRFLVKSGQFRSPIQRLVEVVPNGTTVVTLVLQELLTLGDEHTNVGIKPLLRASDGRRLIFRGIPVDRGELERGPSLEGAVVEFLASVDADELGLGGAGNPVSGPVTSFGAVVAESGLGRSLVAGQWAGGDQGFWRLKNVVEWDVSDSQSIRFSLGYGQLSFGAHGERRIVGDPGVDADVDSFVSGTSRLLSIAVEDNLQLGPVLTLTWGVQLDRVDVGEGHTFVTPQLGVEYALTQTTKVFGRLAGSRPSRVSMVRFASGEVVDLSSPARITELDGRLEADRGRFTSVGVRQQVDRVTEVEVAAFRDRLPSPLVAVQAADGPDALSTLAEVDGNVSGLRVAARRNLSERVKAEISFVRALAPAPAAEFALGRPILPTRLEHFNRLGAAIDAYVPESRTQITAVVTWMPGENALVVLDALADEHSLGNEGLSFFVRQVIPLPEDWLRSLGLDFLASRRLEALLDVRNLVGPDQRTVTTPSGEFHLVQVPRSVRGGLAVRF